MGSINSEGVYEYDDTELWSPQDDYQNLQAAALTAALADIRADIAALGTLVDSDWVTIAGSTGGAIGSGWSAVANHTPRLRKVGDHVHLFGALQLTGAGSFTDLLTITTGFRMVGAFTQTFIGTVVANDGVSTTSAKVLELFLSSVTHKVSVPDGYRTGSLPANSFVVLKADWFTN